MSHVEEKAVPAGAFLTPLWSHVFRGWADRIVAGQLTIQFPDGTSHVVRGPLPGPCANLNLRNGRLLWRMAGGGSLGLARGYIEGDWDTTDLSALLELGLVNEQALHSLLDAPGLGRLLAYLRHRRRANTRAGSKRNIAFHYDLGNDFYREWLDETMTYSSAIFAHPEQSLAEAQLEKYARVVRELGLGADDHVLEIGCGWGGFAEFAARETGCRITCLTLSREQARFARDRIAAAGLAERVEIRLEDYRDCAGQFDKIVSIEMFEAVGEENWPTYFTALRTLLRPGGRALLQVITIAEASFEEYRRKADFIQTYIFPGGMLPSRTAFAAAASAQKLHLVSSQFFGRDYEKTLQIWDTTFSAAWHRIQAHGFDARFRRMWHYYLQYCAIGFRAGKIDVGQFLLQRPG
ncbi:SAM-dependent methyltransferase [Kaistia adipata]|uniref:SAM-dependent methyltransferase n=1 Tax=Kaistia adipata TaxID=166954 RepID=UPI000491A8BB|nr:cyclopropane-fatty-acyl-phospholipid synthase family protein [Kaistia adipata]